MIENMDKFKKYLCIDNHVTIYAFYSTCSQLGYPIMLPVENHVDTMKLAELIMDLTKELYTPEFGEDWSKIIMLNNQYKDRKKLYEYLKYISENDETEWNKIIHQYRSKATSFFHRYMMLWRIGKASQEMFDNVDVPGKSRIYTFIHVCETIDEVNYKEKRHLDQT